MSNEERKPMEVSILGVSEAGLADILAKVERIEAAALRAGAALAALDKVPPEIPLVAQADLSLYNGDDYPRAGCTLVVQVADGGWAMRVYAPGYPPVGEAGAIERYAFRAHGSTGIAVDAFIQRGADFRWALGAMSKAERDYSSKSGSSVTV